eukprot:TCALIF_01324-PA protein Name:"Similar to MPI Mannose-6-phosphate isomerase (Macaca fascicularis)" AED:0.15 eAED:0.15 QI:2/0/0/1/0.75/0.8/5/0/691
MMELLCDTKSYAWGKIGGQSEVFSLRRSVDPESVSDESQPYAELWMGTHPSGPSRIKSNSEPLKEFLESQPDLLGSSVTQFGKDLPYLFKVLSVNKALSIQAHPNKEHAERLFKERPNIYKDPNHKPEMAIALTPFQGLCGFRPLQEIQKNVQESPLKDILKEGVAEALLAATPSTYSEALKEAFKDLMTTPKETIANEFAKFKTTLESTNTSDLNSTQRLFLTLAEQYPEDVGCFVIYFVNLVELNPGEALFLGPNLIHAYLSGDCIECMACSDNVVRSGLTPKLIDTPTLIEMLDYSCKPVDDMKFQPEQETEWTTVYNPPVPDFAVVKIDIDSDSMIEIPKRSSASIFLVISGSGRYEFEEGPQSFQRGAVHFLGANQGLKIVKQSQEKIVIKMASSDALKRMEAQANAADQLISVLKKQIQEIKCVAQNVDFDSEIKTLKSENLSLKTEIDTWKGRLIAEETKKGVPQYPVPVSKSSPSVTETSSAEIEKTSEPPKAHQDQSQTEGKKSNKKDNKKKLKEGGKENQAQPSADAPIDVGRLDMRVGLIRSATKHPDADALYVEEVDVGEDKPRTVISGLVKFIPLEEMQNRKAILLCNLKPSKMRGIMSEAMVEILSPPESSKPGDPILVDGFTRNPDAQLNPKKKIFEACAPDLKVSGDKVATYKGVAWTVNGEKCHAQTLSNVQIK